MKTNFFKKKNNTDLKLFNVYGYKSYILNKCCDFFNFLLIKESWNKYHRFPILIINQNSIKCILKYIKNVYKKHTESSE